ncbi:hypothetical protein [Natrinema halophilum]|uniref:hypothetical protein n=1 Tax=Natrinema halophilum TaxID=1699371 RepID=UPI0031BA871C
MATAKCVPSASPTIYVPHVINPENDPKERDGTDECNGSDNGLPISQTDVCRDEAAGDDGGRKRMPARKPVSFAFPRVR